MNRFFYDNSFIFRMLRHVLFFLVTVLVFTEILYLQNRAENFIETFWITLLNAIFFFSYAYLTIFLLIPEFLIKKKILLFIVLSILIGFGLSAIKLIASDQIFYSSISPENIERAGIMNLRFIVVNTKDMTFIVALFCIAKYVKDYLYAERLRKELEIQTKEAQRKLFQAQFDPHFLFNTINNLYALSLLNPLKTRNVIKRIKIVLSYIIEEIQKENVDLQDEILLVENYIQLEKMRYGKRLKVDLEIEGDCASKKIPPMILFFLVENCFKHGSSLDAGMPWIKLVVNAENNKLILSAYNSKPKTLYENIKKEKSSDHLMNLKKRLNILYSPKGYDLKIWDEKDSFKVVLVLKRRD